MKGKINIELKFPIIVSVDGEYSVSMNIDEYTILPKKHITELIHYKEFIIDLDGNLYNRTEIIPIQLINRFCGFSFKFGKFNVCYVEKIIEKIGSITEEGLKKECKKIIDTNKDYYINADVHASDLYLELEELIKMNDITQFMVKIIRCAW